MPTFRRFLSRRWLLGSLAAVALLFGVLMLHPYPRQSLFGPTIDGIPWCVWENEVRRRVDDDRSSSWLAKWLEKTGWTKQNRGELNLANEAVLPLYLHLADDGDVRVRRYALSTLAEWADWFPRRDDEILPIMRRHLQDDDSDCRSSAVSALEKANEAVGLKALALP